MLEHYYDEAPRAYATAEVVAVHVLPAAPRGAAGRCYARPRLGTHGVRSEEVRGPGPGAPARTASRGVRVGRGERTRAGDRPAAGGPHGARHPLMVLGSRWRRTPGGVEELLRRIERAAPRGPDLARATPRSTPASGTPTPDRVRRRIDVMRGRLRRGLVRTGRRLRRRRSRRRGLHTARAGAVTVADGHRGAPPGASEAWGRGDGSPCGGRRGARRRDRLPVRGLARVADIYARVGFDRVATAVHRSAAGLTRTIPSEHR